MFSAIALAKYDESDDDVNIMREKLVKAMRENSMMEHIIGSIAAEMKEGRRCTRIVMSQDNFDAFHTYCSEYITPEESKILRANGFKGYVLGAQIMVAQSADKFTIAFETEKVFEKDRMFVVKTEFKSGGETIMKGAKARVRHNVVYIDGSFVKGLPAGAIAAYDREAVEKYLKPV